MRWLILLLLGGCLTACVPKAPAAPTPRPTAPAQVDPSVAGDTGAFALVLYRTSALAANELIRNPGAHVMPLPFDYCNGGPKSLYPPRWVSPQIVPPGESEDHRRRRELVLAACAVVNDRGTDTVEKFDRAQALLEQALSSPGR